MCDIENIGGKYVIWIGFWIYVIWEVYGVQVFFKGVDLGKVGVDEIVVYIVID